MRRREHLSDEDIKKNKALLDHNNIQQSLTDPTMVRSNSFICSSRTCHPSYGVFLYSDSGLPSLSTSTTKEHRTMGGVPGSASRKPTLYWPTNQMQAVRQVIPSCSGHGIV